MTNDLAPVYESFEDESVLAINRLSDAALEMVPWWSPDVPPWEPIKDKNSSLRIACVVSDRLYQGLQFEGEVYLLTPKNWRATLEDGAPDFLLVESFWESATGHWTLAQATPGPESDELRELVSTAKSLGIPTVYWFTEDHAYHGHYSEMASHFEHVFCSDLKEIELLKQEGIESLNLAPCVQPALYNPFRRHEHYDALDLGVLFDGWGELDRFPDEFSVLDEIAEEHPLNIIESRYLLTRNQLKTNPRGLGANILGCVTQKTRQLSLKYAKAYVTFERTLSTETTRQWQALEASASYLPILHLGKFEDGDLRANISQSFEDELDFQVELIRMKEDEIYRQRIAHLAWRETLSKHTYSHRVRTISERIGVEHDWEEYPKALTITPTSRPNNVPNAIYNYRKQTYPNKKLALVYNGEKPAALPMESQAEDIYVSHVPGDLFAGAAMNMGSKLASSTFTFRFDDDDDYGKDYLSDMMLAVKAVDPDLLGKPFPVAFRFQDEDSVWASIESQKPFALAKGSGIHKNYALIPGNSIGMPANGTIGAYQVKSLSSADSLLKRQVPAQALILITDVFNLVAYRSSEESSHTWKVEPETLKNSRTQIYYEDLEI